MIKALEGLDRTVAAGVLARAALSLGYVDNPSVSLKSDDERIYTTVVNEARAKLGLADDDYSPEAIEQLSDFLDAQSDELLTPPDTQSALVPLHSDYDSLDVLG